tara:strand:+ start:918 stop:1211 length:294 start_codon:yes stop_codon:yes gene_type:complete
MNCGCGQNPCKTYGSQKNKNMAYDKRVSPGSTMSDMVDGLYVKDGRLINARPDGMSGIQQASMYRSQMKKQYKIDCIADGIERAKMRMDGDKNIYEL